MLFRSRKKNGLSQEQLAEKIGVARQTISKWELGETYPDLEQSKKLSSIFKVSLDELTNNDIRDVLVEKVINTEKTTKKSFDLIKLLALIIVGFTLLFFGLVIIHIVSKNLEDRGREIDETIHCKLYGEEHSYNIVYYELTGKPFASGGDPYFYDILDLGKYEDAHQIFNIINDYVKKNGGTCEMIYDHDLNDTVDFYVKEGTLTKSSATFILENKYDYHIGYGESFWIEKYDSKTHDFQALKNTTDNNCAFNMIGYNLTKDSKVELKQDWSCMYNELDKGLYRIVKNVSFNSDTPITEDSVYYIWAEFEIEE